ncbi:FRG domain-containing protein, partial [Acinetobacter baumannii]|nr:FRG domain-containing protein [Acinetobacter baumannii]
MGNKYYDQLVNNDSHFEITFNDFEEFITFIRPDKLHVKDLMTQLRLEFNPSAVNFPFFKIKDFKGYSTLDKSIIYRGHGESDWDLKPTFYRNKKNIGWVKTNWSVDQNYESEILLKFQDSCDLAGVQLPSDNDQLRRRQKNKLSKYRKSFGRDQLDWFDDDFFELAVYAQHYGVETRLLDWTKNPFVASYFACSHALKMNYDPNSKFCIWVLNSESITNELNQVLEVLDPPKGLNQHISHQQGVLTYTKNHIKIFNKFGTRPCLKDILKYYESGYRLLKITLGYELIVELFNYCNIHNFNACHLFRGANGAAMHT